MRRGQLERRGREARRLVDPVAEDDRARRTRPGTASPRGCVRITSPSDVVEGRLLAAEQLVDAVEAVELLGPLLQVVEDAVDRLVGVGFIRSSVPHARHAAPRAAVHAQDERRLRAHVPDVLGAGHDLLRARASPSLPPAPASKGTVK